MAICAIGVCIENMFRCRLIATVACARIFYHCHYIGDTLVGALVGTAVVYTLQMFNIQSLAVMIAQYMSEVGNEMEAK